MPGKQYTTAPILVNADGHPIPQYLDTTDTTDSPQGTFKPLTQLQAERSDVQNVQLTGSNVEKTLIERGVYQNNPPAVFESNIPDGARGCMISVIVYGVTGSFENDEGLRLSVTQRGGVNKLLNAYDFGVIQTEMTTNVSNHVVILYPSIDLTNFIALGEVNAVSIPPFGTLRIGVSVTGTFAEGEGFDLSATIQYLQ